MPFLWNMRRAETLAHELHAEGWPMSMHFVSRPWQVQDVEDGTIVKLSEQDLDASLGDELLDLAQESGRPNLYLDLLEVPSLPGAVAARLFTLDRRLRSAGGRLVLCNLAPGLSEALQARSS
jgi:anti-anti-sigma regulatory factor